MKLLPTNLPTQVIANEVGTDPEALGEGAVLVLCSILARPPFWVSAAVNTMPTMPR